MSHVITAPEIEMLIIFAENQYKDSKSQGKNQVIFARKILECLT